MLKVAYISGVCRTVNIVSPPPILDVKIKR
jgi:hypothetical protein